MNDKNNQQNDQDVSEQSEFEGQKGGQSEATIDQNQGNTQDVTEVADLGAEEEETSDSDSEATDSTM